LIGGVTGGGVTGGDVCVWGAELLPPAFEDAEPEVAPELLPAPEFPEGPPPPPPPVGDPGTALDPPPLAGGDADPGAGSDGAAPSADPPATVLRQAAVV